MCTVLAVTPGTLHAGGSGGAASIPSGADPRPVLAGTPAEGRRFSLCVGGREFWSSLQRDIQKAEDYVYVQTLSFEADVAGAPLAEAMLSSSAPDKRIIIDSFTKYVLSDRFIYAPWNLLDGSLREEVDSTEALVAELETGGVGVLFARPVGWRLYQFAARDHKKLVIIDDSVAYIGGINFSEHNFVWHDLMLRIEDGDVSRFLREDFLSTWNGKEQVSSRSFPGIDLLIADGGGNHNILNRVGGRIASARESIYLECPYVTEPFFNLLARARERGVEVQIVSSEENNRIFMKDAIKEACERFDLSLLLCDGMTHVKAMLIDDETLVLGSANFDFPSFGLQPEVVAIITDPTAVSEFRERVAGPALGRSREWNGESGRWLRRLSYDALHLAGGLIRVLNGGAYSSGSDVAQ